MRLKGDKENPTSVDIVNSLNGNASERARDGAVRRGSGGAYVGSDRLLSAFL